MSELGHRHHLLENSQMQRFGPFAALGHSFQVQTKDNTLGSYVDAVFKNLASLTTIKPATTYTLLADAPAPWSYVLLVDGKGCAESEDPRYVLHYLFWHVNRQAVERSEQHVILHAAGVAREGVGCVLPAASECGKTTLAAGLVQRGFKYLTDEAVAVNPETMTLHAFPKALSIDRGSWTVLPDLEPEPTSLLRTYPPEQWHVPASDIRDNALASTATPKVVISPRYREGAKTEITPVKRSDMVVRLATLTFDFRSRLRRNASTLARLASASACFDLVVGDLDEACSLVDGAVAQALSLEGASNG